MKVWLIKRDEYDTGDYNEIMEIHATKEAADHARRNDWGSDGYMVEEWEVIE